VSSIFIRLAVDLQEPTDDSPLSTRGPHFHRWLPDGQADAISLHTGHPGFDLKVWFERRGFVQNGFIHFSYDRREVDPAIMSSQGQLDAGPLKGLLHVHKCPENAYSAITSEAQDNPDYASFAKTIVQDIVAPPLQRLFSVLRIAYGQYWLPEFDQWDSRTGSLGAYCQRLNLQWARDLESSWSAFLPDKPVYKSTIVVQTSEHYYRELLTKQDWNDLPELARTSSHPTPAEIVMRRAHELLYKFDIRFALVEAVTALELAIEEFTRSRQATSSAIQKHYNAFYSLPLPAKMIAIVTSAGLLPVQTIESAAAAIEQRHRLVHEGRSPTSSVRGELEALLRVTASLLSRLFYKFPVGRHANSIAPPEAWDELYRRHGLSPLNTDGG